MTTQPPRLLILNQMAGPMTWELAEDIGESIGRVALLTGHPDTLAKSSTETILIYRAAAYKRGGIVRRALSWLRYLWRAFWWVWGFPRHVPLLLFSNPPVLCWLGLVMRLIRGQRYFVMVHDIYPDVLVALKQLPARHWLVQFWRKLNRVAYQQAEAVMTLGECMAETLATQFDPAKTPAQKIEVIYPWVDTDKIKPIPKEQNWFAQKYGQVDKLTVMYSGNMGLGHDIETMIEVARRLRGELHIHFMFIGSGPKWFLVEEALQRENLPNVTLLPWQPENSLTEQLSTADLGLVSLEETLQGLAIPSKAIYMLAAGVPLLGVASGSSDLQLLIERNGCGVLVPPRQPERCIKEIIDLLSTNEKLAAVKDVARRTAISLYARQKNTQQLLRLLSSHVSCEYASDTDICRTQKTKWDRN